MLLYRDISASEYNNLSKKLYILSSCENIRCISPGKKSYLSIHKSCCSANPLLLLQKILLLKYWTWLMSVVFLPIIAKWDIQESFQTIIIALNSLWPMILWSFLINYIEKNYHYYLEIKNIYLKQNLYSLQFRIGKSRSYI